MDAINATSMFFISILMAAAAPSAVSAFAWHVPLVPGDRGAIFPRLLTLPIRSLRRPVTFTPLSLSSSSSSSSEPELRVRVYDNVFSPQASDRLSSLAEEHRERQSDSTIFYRPPPDEFPLSPLEAAIDSALAAMGDVSEVVEYWSREEYINIDLHSDIDEEELLGDYGGGTIRCPDWAHVAYLRVDDGVRGPTVVFPDRLKGWARGAEDGRSTGAGAGARAGTSTSMVTVPAVVGRVLRFDGSAMHAVPKPADRWLLPDADERRLREEENDDCEGFWRDEDEEEWDDEDEGSEDPIRSVLLFNTWRTPPMGVDTDGGLSSLGIEIVEAAGVEGLGCREEEEDTAMVLCNEKSTWEQVTIARGDATDVDDGSAKSEQVRVCLMGDKERRCHPKAKATLVTKSADRLREASFDARTPTSFVLSEPQS